MISVYHNAFMKGDSCPSATETGLPRTFRDDVWTMLAKPGFTLRYRRSPLLKSSFKKHTVIDRHSVRGQEATQLKSILIVGFASQVCAFVTTCTVGHRYEGDGLAESRTVHSQWVLRRRDGVLQCQVSLCNPVADTVDYVRNITLRCSTKNVARGERDGGEPGTMSCLVKCSTSLSSQ